MEKHIMQLIAEQKELSIQNYSGRGMYGKSCLAIVARYSLEQFISSCITALKKIINDTPDNKVNEYLDQFAEAIENMKHDSLGLDYVFYFPGTKYFLEDEFSDQDEEMEESDL